MNMPKSKTAEDILLLVYHIHDFLSSFIFTGTRSERKEISEARRN
jgi:hypothetical protein